MSIFSTLRAAIAADHYDPAVVLGAIAESAQALTGATAAALAMRRDGLVICRARSGEMAPEVGSRLSVDSGISGECLRTNKVLRCDDTLKDYRADPDVCRRLGLRSIAAVPLRGSRGTMGVLEAFSTRPYAFAEEHMDYLIRLAELAEAARLRETGVVPAAVESSSLPPRLPVAASSGPLLWAKGASAQFRGQLGSRAFRLTLSGLAASLLVLLGFIGWNSWRKTPTEAAAKIPAAQVQPSASTAAASPATGVDLVWKPSPAHVAASVAGSSSGIVPAAKREVDQVTAVPQPSPSPLVAQTNTSAAASLPQLSQPDSSNVIEAPTMGALVPGRGLPSMASIPVDPPAFGSPVSQGLSGGVLQHKVQPVYPIQALPLRLAGAVVLQATIGEKGKVDELKVVSGPPLLTAAAIDAVRQWRYTPFLLNGKPVKMQKEITISFQAP